MWFILHRLKLLNWPRTQYGKSKSRKQNMIDAILSEGTSKGLTEPFEENTIFIQGWGSITHRTEQGDSQTGGGNLTVRVGGKLFFNWRENRTRNQSDHLIYNIEYLSSYPR